MISLSPTLSAQSQTKTITLKTSDFLSSDLMNGEHYQVTEKIRVHGYMNHYTVESGVGIFYASSNANLKILLTEINAIYFLQQIQRKDEFIKAVKKTAKMPIEITKNIITHPVETAKAIPNGIVRLFKRTSYQIKEGKKVISKTLSKNKSKQPNQTKSEKTNKAVKAGSKIAKNIVLNRIGFNKAKREWSKKLNIDPYSSNRLLQNELNNVAWVSTAGSFGVNFVFPSLPSIYNYIKVTNKLVWTLDPLDLKIRNKEILKNIGIQESQIDIFYANQFYSPTSRTQITNAVAALQEVKNIIKYFTIIIDAQSLVEVDFYTTGLSFLAQYNTTKIALKSLVLETRIPLAITTTGDIIAIANLDYLTWDSRVSNFFSMQSKLVADNGNNRKLELFITGIISPETKINIKSSDWQVYEHALDNQ